MKFFSKFSCKQSQKVLNAHAIAMPWHTPKEPKRSVSSISTNAKPHGEDFVFRFQQRIRMAPRCLRARNSCTQTTPKIEQTTEQTN